MKFKINDINFKKIKQIGKTVVCTVVIGTTAFLATACGMSNEHREYIINANTNSIVDYQDGSYEISGVATNDDLKIIPSYVSELEIIDSGFITELDNLYIYGISDQVKVLTIYNCPGITDLDIIYKMPNLEELYLNECPGITQELVNYLNSNGIEHNITEQDIKNSQKIDEIINEIIKDGMTEREKINAISLYIAKNYSYDISLADESNDSPLTCMLENEKGVCASYAYLTQVLLTRAGVNSYILKGDKTHAWNLVETDDKYYYLDVTNIKQLFGLSLLSIEYLDRGCFYMIDPSATGLSAMTKYNAGPSKIVIPKTLVEEIEKSETEKDFYEKYGNSRLAYDIQLLLPIIGIGLGIKGGFAFKEMISTKKRKRKIKEELRKKRKIEQLKMKEEKLKKKIEEKEARKKMKSKQIIEEKTKEKQIIDEEKVTDYSISKPSVEETYIEEPKKEIKESEEEKNEEIKPLKELTEFEKKLEKFKEDNEQFSHTSALKYQEYSIYKMKTNSDISFIEYLETIVGLTAMDLISFEKDRIYIIDEIYKAYKNRYPEISWYDERIFLEYCKNISPIVKELGGIGYIIGEVDIIDYMHNLLKEQYSEQKKL